VAPIRPTLRPIAFVRLTVTDPLGGDRPVFPVTVALGEASVLEVRLMVVPRALGVAEVRLPRHALHHASVPGGVRRADDGDVWMPASPVSAATLELLPATVVLRNAGFARLKDYLYTPNPGAALGCLTLAAMARVLTGRRARPATPPPA
jgi:hypothetical protein